MSIEDMIETLADGVGKIADILAFRFDNFNYDEINMLSDIFYDVNYIKEELAKLKGGAE